nr:MAG TPA: hypothetical protein [Caudoviricetes sp.]
MDNGLTNLFQKIIYTFLNQKHFLVFKTRFWRSYLFFVFMIE